MGHFDWPFTQKINKNSNAFESFQIGRNFLLPIRECSKDIFGSRLT
jgi:hypothetical protein